MKFVFMMFMLENLALNIIESLKSVLYIIEPTKFSPVVLMSLKIENDRLASWKKTLLKSWPDKSAYDKSALWKSAPLIVAYLRSTFFKFAE